MLLEVDLMGLLTTAVVVEMEQQQVLMVLQQLLVVEELVQLEIIQEVQDQLEVVGVEQLEVIQVLQQALEQPIQVVVVVEHLIMVVVELVDQE